jgi:hypothetical protein
MQNGRKQQQKFQTSRARREQELLKATKTITVILSFPFTAGVRT